MKKTIAMLSSILMLGTCITEFLPVHAAASESASYDEWSKPFLEQHKDEFFLDEDGVFYSTYEVGDFVMAEYIPSAGVCDRSHLLWALPNEYPDGRFAVQFQCFPYDQTEQEVERLHQIGIEATVMNNRVFGSHLLYAIMTAEQIESFPDENLGYFMGLASNGVRAGDINADNEINMLDAVYLQKYLLKMTDFDYVQWHRADINRDEVVDIFDLALLKKMITDK